MAAPETRKMSPSDFRMYNHLAEMMEYYHNHFRTEWNTLYAGVSSSSSSSRLSAPQLVRIGLQFLSGLTLHHNIEEARIFPLLARKMPAFRPAPKKSSSRTSAAASAAANASPTSSAAPESFVPSSEEGFAIAQHKLIHAGMDKLEAYLTACREGEREMRRDEVKVIMDGFGGVLWKHLDEEVRELGAENMRKVGWTLEEMDRLRF